MKPLLRFMLAAGLVVPLAVRAEARPGGWNSPRGGGSVCWVQAPSEQTGWYWMYDDESDPPFTEPEIMPITSVYFQDITSTGNKLAPYNDEPFKYALQDSFWYYGGWYEPGDFIYISPDGWIAFESFPNWEDGAPYPPSSSPVFPNTDDPDALIAPLWADYNPTLDPAASTDHNRVYYQYDDGLGGLVVQWYQVKSNGTGETYDFEVILRLGGQGGLIDRGNCGVVFSYHFIHFLYNDASGAWTDDNAATGFEDQTGTLGITYEGVVANDRVIRAGYKKIFVHDVAAYAFLSPGSLVLRYTPIEPVVVVINEGKETEHFSAVLEIYDPDGNLIYDHSMAAFNLHPEEKDTITCPCWEPEEIGTSYSKRLIVLLDADECHDNDTFEAESYVHCDDTMRFNWGFADWTVGWGLNDTIRVADFYDCAGGALVSGGGFYLSGANPAGIYWKAGLWQAENGCGLPLDPPVATATPESNRSGWNRVSWDPPVFVQAGNPGNIWFGVIPTSFVHAVYLSLSPNVPPPNHPCYLGEWGNSAWWVNGDWGWSDPYDSFFVYSCFSELYVHLSFGSYPYSPGPGPPCYYDNPHDITCYRMEQPDQEYVPDGVPITPELAITNIGRQAEPDAGYFPVIFRAIVVEDGSTHYEDTVLIGGANKIGWLGDDEDGPDSMYCAFPPWTPESKCEEDEPWVSYDCYGFVVLGEVGPDESDHCPYNDTVYKMITCLWQHDVGVYDISHTDFDAEPDIFNPGTEVIITAQVENFGYNAENDVPVNCEIVDVGADPDTLVYTNTQNLAFIDWRGNQAGHPYTAEVEFPRWVVPSTNWFVPCCRTELPGDMCPDNDFECYNTNSGIASETTDYPSEFSLSIQNGISYSHSINYAISAETRVELAVYDINGRKVATLHNGLTRPGYYNLTWDGRDNAGRTVSAGIYLVRMKAAEFCAARKLLIVR